VPSRANPDTGVRGWRTGHREIQRAECGTGNANAFDMRRPSSLGWVGLAATVVGMSLPARDVRAQGCNVAADCPKGFACTPTGTDADGGTELTCVGGQCQSDSDCGAGFRCLFGLGTICTTDADGGQDCQPNNVCVPQWEVPCTEDSQCGQGFSCVVDGGSVASNPSATVASVGTINCGPSRFDASIPSYATATWINCDAVPLPPLASLCDGGNDDAQVPCIPPICEPGTMCLSITTNACSGPASGQSCRSAADCPATWTCACPFTCATGIILPPDASPAAVDPGCATACIPPNADLSPDRGCGGGASGFAPASATGALDAGSSAPPTRESGAPTTPSQESDHGGCQSAPGRGAGGGWASLLVIALAMASTRARAVRSRTRLGPTVPR
jgi:hypothetical protein